MVVGFGVDVTLLYGTVAGEVQWGRAYFLAAISRFVSKLSVRDVQAVRNTSLSFREDSRVT